MKKVFWIIFWLLINACIDPIKFNVPPAEIQLVVDGLITDEPGPYTVSLTRARTLDEVLLYPLPVVGAKVTILSDAGESEVLTESANGVFNTKSIQGKVGRSYSIRITTADGKTYESAPEKMAPVGEIEKLDFKFVRNTFYSNGAELFSDQFNIYVDGRAATGVENFIRWRLVGTYQIENFPQFIVTTGPGGVVIPAPAPCSGYVVRSGGIFYVDPCTCCNCWITDYELPVVSDDQVLAAGVFKNVRVGSVPIGRRTFYDKYHVEVQQMALTREAFTFWKLVKAQKDGASSLFQPPLARLRGNIYNRLDATEPVQGFFSAASIRRKTIFITKQDIPYNMQLIDTVKLSCLGTINTTNIRPPFWK